MCSVVKWSDNDVAVVVARSMDWMEDVKSDLWLFPRGMIREGLTGQNSSTWTSKYGCVITSAYNIASTDGINEKSLAGHMLWLAESEYGKRDENIPGLSVSLWLQLFLDNFATVNGAVSFVQEHPLQLVPVIAGTSGEVSNVHMMIEDILGDVAVFEYTDGGKPKIYHSNQYTVMTNSPTNKTLPGTTEAADRFVRAAYYQKSLPAKVTSNREAVAGVISVARNVSQPFGTADPFRPNISSTLWRFESTTSPNIIWVHLDELDFSKGAPVKKIDLVNYPDRVGNVSAEFKDTEPFEWAKPLI